AGPASIDTAGAPAAGIRYPPGAGVGSRSQPPWVDRLRLAAQGRKPTAKRADLWLTGSLRRYAATGSRRGRRRRASLSLGLAGPPRRDTAGGGHRPDAIGLAEILPPDLLSGEPKDVAKPLPPSRAADAPEALNRLERSMAARVLQAMPVAAAIQIFNEPNLD